MKYFFLFLCCIAGTSFAQEATDRWDAQISYSSIDGSRFVSSPIQFNGDDPKEKFLTGWKVRGSVGHQFAPRWSWDIGLAKGQQGFALAYAGTVDQFIDTDNPLLSPLSDILNSPLIAFISGEVKYELQLEYISLPIGFRHELHKGKWLDAFTRFGLEVFHYTEAEESLHSILVNNFINGDNTLLRDRLVDINQWNLGAHLGLGLEARLDPRVSLSSQIVVNAQAFDIWKESGESARLYGWGWEFALRYQL